MDAEAAGFFLQQSLEKYLKAFLLKHNWKLRKIHELDALLDEAAKFQQDLETYRDLCERVYGYYIAELPVTLLSPSTRPSTRPITFVFITCSLL